MLLYLPQTNIIYPLSKHLLPTAVKKNAGSRGSILVSFSGFPYLPQFVALAWSRTQPCLILKSVYTCSLGGHD